MQKFKIEIKWAIIFLIMQLCWMLMEKITGLHHVHIDKHYIVTNIIAIPAVAIFIFALRDKRRNFYHGQMSYKQGFMTGFVMTVIITIFTPLVQYITSTFISPDYFENVITYSVNEGKMTLLEAENYFNLRSYIIQATIGAFIMGNLTAAIVAVFTKSKKQKEIVNER